MCYNAFMNASTKPTKAVSRAGSLLRTGPFPIALRFVDQLYRLLTGAPLWKLSAVTPQLLLGGQHYPRGYAAMLSYGITTIVNMREAHHCDEAKGIAGERHLHLATIDNMPPALDDLLRGVEFLDCEIKLGGAVYIHCGVGVGRAPTMTAAYLVSTGMSPADALRRIKKARPFIHLTAAQRQVLDEFEQHWQKSHLKSLC